MVGPVAVFAAAVLSAPTQPAAFQRAEVPSARFASAHYDLRVQGSQEEAATLGKILELAWPTFRDFFQAEPPLAGDARLLVKVFDTREACLDGAMDDKVDMPPAQHPAWFSPKNGAVYLYRHTSEWFTRYLAIYGACLQFHGLAKPKNRDLDTWYTHGIAESFAVHSFDGERLELGVSPPICWIDHPARALAQLGGKRLGLDPFTDERLEDPSVRWAVARFAIRGAEGRYRPRFEKLALGVSGSKLSGHDFLRSLGQEERIAEEFTVWLLSTQIPLTAVLPDWQAFSDGRIVAKPAKDGLSLCAVKEGFTSIEAVIDLPGSETMPGIVLSLQDQWNYVAARIVPPVAFVEHVLDGKKRALQTVPAEPSGGKLRVAAAWSGGAVHLTIGERSLPPMDAPDGQVGLASFEGLVTFRDVRWR